MSNYYNRQWRLPNNENKDKQSNYSMDFTVFDKISLGSSVDLGINSSVSLWINMPNTPTTYIPLGEDSYLADYLMYISSTLIYIVIGNVYKTYTHSFNTNQWYHIVIVREGDSIEVFKDNTSLGTQTGFGTSVTTKIDTIGAKTNGNNTFIGLIDAVTFFDYALSSSQITTLYGSSSTGIGNPMSLSPKPVAYYPLGDQDSFNGSNYLVPNIAAQEADGDIATSYSPYALDFDGANDFVQTNGFTIGNNYSLSCWLKSDTTSPSTSVFLSSPNYYGAGYNGNFIIRFTNSTTIQMYSFDGTANSESSAATIPTIGTNWHHFALTSNGTTTNIYWDGSPLTVTGNQTKSLDNLLQGLIIGYEVNFGNNPFNGKLSNVSVWNTALTSAQVTEIYSEGVPQNLNNHSAYSNLVSWWQLGSNSSFNTNWTVLDEKGSNNGTSSNMGEDAIVDGVNTYGGGTSSGMGGDEVIGDAPYSSSNSLSVNMDVLDRTTDTPS